MKPLYIETFYSNSPNIILPNYVESVSNIYFDINSGRSNYPISEKFQFNNLTKMLNILSIHFNGNIPVTIHYYSSIRMIEDRDKKIGKILE